MTFPSPYEHFIYTRTYSRFNDELGRRETWDETVNRYQSFMLRRVPSSKKAEFKKACEGILNFEVMPSMRALWTAGPALEESNVCAFNCSYLAIDDPNAFAEALYILMNGVGVGFSTERQFIANLPQVPDSLEQSKKTIIFEDSKLGWADGFNKIIMMLYSGKIPLIDYSKVRPKGARLMTFGGRSSGPEPLQQLCEYTIEVFKSAVGRKLSSIECHDIMCMVAQIVVVGGVRRSACISLSNLSDDRMRHAKDGRFWEHNPQRMMANNSVAYTEKPSADLFMSEWLSLIRSGSGERGIFNRNAAQFGARKTGRRAYNQEYGTNPCVTYETPILTSEGHIPIGECVGKEISVWNGREFSHVVPFSTGFNEVVRVHLSDGAHLDCTPYHKFILSDETRVEAKDLAIGDKLVKFNLPVIETGKDYEFDAYSHGFYCGDGNWGLGHSWLYSTKYCCEHRLVGEIINGSVKGRKVWKHGPMMDKDFVPVDATREFCIEWLAGLLDSDGTVCKNPNSVSVQVSSIDKEFLLRVKLMLTRLGVSSKVVTGNSAGERMMPDGKGGSKLYTCKNCWRLLIGSTQVEQLVSIGLKTSRLKLDCVGAQRDASRFVAVVSIEQREPEETYCLTEPKNNSAVFGGILTAQCAEIILRPRQFCNLSEVVIRHTDTLDDLERKVRQATILGCVQSTLTKFKFLSRDWKKNTEEERLLGVSLTGLRDHPVLGRVSPEAKKMLMAMKQVALDTAKEWSAALSINMPAAITCCKPSGTVSQLVNSSSGIHPRYAPYYIRRVRVSKSDPLAQMLIDQGVKWSPEVGQTVDDCSIVVFDFPIASPKNSVFRDETNAIEQLEYWLMLKEHWAEHSVSSTIYVSENEWVQVAAWVYENWDQLTGLSFLPYSGGVYQLAPYQEIGEAMYNRAVSESVVVDYSKLSEYEATDMTIGSKEYACHGGACEL